MQAPDLIHRPKDPGLPIFRFSTSFVASPTTQQMIEERASCQCFFRLFVLGLVVDSKGVTAPNEETSIISTLTLNAGQSQNIIHYDEATSKPNASTIRELKKYVHKICTRGLGLELNC